MATRRVRGGKRIDRWTIRHEGISRTVDLYLVGTEFRAINDDLEIDETGPEIQGLKDRVFGLIKARTTVQWVRWLYLTIQGIGTQDPEEPGWRERYGDAESLEFDIKIHARVIERATIDGNPRWRTLGGYSGRELNRGDPEVGPIPYDPDRPYWEHARPGARCLVLDTPENRQAIERFRDRFRDLGAQLAGLFEPSRVAQTFATLARGGLALTPGPTAPIRTRGAR